MGKLCQEFLDLDEILPYDKGELQVWNLTDSHLEEVINYVFDNEVKNSNGDTNSREPVGSESDQDSWYHTESEGVVPEDVVDVPSDPVILLNLSGGESVSQPQVCIMWWQGVVGDRFYHLIWKTASYAMIKISAGSCAVASEGGLQQTVWDIKVLYQQYFEWMQDIYWTIPVTGGGSVPLPIKDGEP